MSRWQRKKSKLHSWFKAKLIQTTTCQRIRCHCSGVVSSMQDCCRIAQYNAWKTCIIWLSASLLFALLVLYRPVAEKATRAYVYALMFKRYPVVLQPILINQIWVSIVPSFLNAKNMKRGLHKFCTVRWIIGTGYWYGMGCCFAKILLFLPSLTINTVAKPAAIRQY